MLGLFSPACGIVLGLFVYMFSACLGAWQLRSELFSWCLRKQFLLIVWGRRQGAFWRHSWHFETGPCTQNQKIMANALSIFPIVDFHETSWNRCVCTPRPFHTLLAHFRRSQDKSELESLGIHLEARPTPAATPTPAPTPTSIPPHPP